MKSGDGRHADYAPAICMALTRWHELEDNRQQSEFESGYQGLGEEEKKIWGRIENNIRAKNKKSSRMRR
jgi:hypothetical protein